MAGLKSATQRSNGSGAPPKKVVPEAQALGQPNPYVQYQTNQSVQPRRSGLIRKERDPSGPARRRKANGLRYRRSTTCLGRVEINVCSLVQVCHVGMVKQDQPVDRGLGGGLHPFGAWHTGERRRRSRIRY